MPDDTAPAWPLPRPAVMFADHSYPAYSAKQMIAYADAREAAAWAAGAAAMRDACMAAIATLYDFHDAPSLYVAYEAIEDLPLPPMPTQGGNADE